MNAFSCYKVFPKHFRKVNNKIEWYFVYPPSFLMTDCNLSGMDTILFSIYNGVLRCISYDLR
ncbi:hypothetical protein Avbf_15717 [Armadillidium vulgare]|nr:hypothetical protein Avbf_15717 [Armadillidium vulgare]